MTVRSWNRTDVLNVSDTGSDARIRDVYAQNGGNTSRALREQGVYPDHPYSMNHQHIFQPMTLCRIGSTVYEICPEYLGANPSYSDVPTPVLAKVVSKLLEKWRNSEFNAGVTIGEGREAAQMMVKRLGQIASAAKQIRHGNLGGALAEFGVKRGRNGSYKRSAQRAMNGKNWSDAWLELQFGWKPLVNDIYALSDHVKMKPRWGVIRASEREFVLEAVGSNKNFPASDIDVRKNERRRHLKVLVSAAPDNIERLGLSDPTTIVWNLTPWSFIVDWFLPISDVLQARHAKRVMPVERCCDTTFIQNSSTLTVRAGQYYGSPFKNRLCLQSATAFYDYVDMSRLTTSYLPSSWSIVSQVPKLINERWDPDVRKLSLGAALVRSRLGRLGT